MRSLGFTDEENAHVPYGSLSQDQLRVGDSDKAQFVRQFYCLNQLLPAPQRYSLSPLSKFTDRFVDFTDFNLDMYLFGLKPMKVFKQEHPDAAEFLVNIKNEYCASKKSKTHQNGQLIMKLLSDFRGKKNERLSSRLESKHLKLQGSIRTNGHEFQVLFTDTTRDKPSKSDVARRSHVALDHICSKNSKLLEDERSLLWDDGKVTSAGIDFGDACCVGVITIGNDRSDTT